MSLKDGLRSYLVADAGLLALVGQRIAQQADQTWANQPYVTFRRIASSPRRHLRGASLTQTFFEIRCVGRTWDEAQRIADAVFETIGRDGRGNLEWGDQRVNLARWDDRSDDFTDPPAGDQKGIPQETLTLIVWHSPAAA